MPQENNKFRIPLGDVLITVRVKESAVVHANLLSVPNNEVTATQLKEGAATLLAAAQLLEGR